MNADFLPYHEPSLVQILVLSSFFVFLNAARIGLDWLANVGILGTACVRFFANRLAHIHRMSQASSS